MGTIFDAAFLPVLRWIEGNHASSLAVMCLLVVIAWLLAFREVERGTK